MHVTPNLKVYTHPYLIIHEVLTSFLEFCSASDLDLEAAKVDEHELSVHIFVFDSYYIVIWWLVCINHNAIINSAKNVWFERIKKKRNSKNLLLLCISEWHALEQLWCVMMRDAPA